MSMYQQIIYQHFNQTIRHTVMTRAELSEDNSDFNTEGISVSEHQLDVRMTSSCNSVIKFHLKAAWANESTKQRSRARQHLALQLCLVTPLSLNTKKNPAPNDHKNFCYNIYVFSQTSFLFMSHNCISFKKQFPEIPAHVKYGFDLRNFNSVM